MKKIEFVNGATIDGAKTFNDMQSNVEEVFNGEEVMGSIRVANVECKNLLKNTATSKTENGLTFTVNPDGTVRVTGTATKDTFLRVVDKIADGGWELPIGTYVLSGGYFNAGSYVACQILHSDGTYNSFAVRSSGWREFEFLEGDTIQFVQIRVGNGATIDFTFKPQIEKGNKFTGFAPYKKFGYNDRESMGKIVVDDISCKNLFNFDNMNMSFATVDYTEKTIKFTGFNNATSNSLKDICPDLVVGETYTFSFKTTATIQYIYLNGSQYTWTNKGKHTITQADLDGYILFYGNTNTSCTISDIQIEKGTVATEYTPYKNFEGRQDIITGQECPTNKYIDGKRVYVKRIDCGLLPDASSKIIATGLNNITWVDFIGIANNGNYPYKMEYKKVSDYSIVLAIDNNQVKIVTYVSSYTTYTGYVELYYTKNNTSSTMMYSPRPTINGDETNTLEDEITTLEETLEEI